MVGGVVGGVGGKWSGIDLIEVEMRGGIDQAVLKLSWRGEWGGCW